MINVIIADDQEIIRDGIKMILSLSSEINVIGEAENGDDLLQLLKRLMPDVVLMDVRMPKINGIAATKIIKERYRSIKVIILTTFNEDKYIFEAIKNGADGYLLKDAGGKYIINAVKSAYGGEILLDPKVACKVVKAFNSMTDTEENQADNKNLSNKLDLLTAREIDVADLIAQGKSNKDICKILYLTEGTIKNYVTRILSKLELTSRTELAVFMNQVNMHKKNVQ